MSTDLHKLSAELPEVYTAQGCIIWLLAPHKLLDGKCAAEVWLAGDHDRVLGLVDQLLTGAFG